LYKKGFLTIVQAVADLGEGQRLRLRELVSAYVAFSGKGIFIVGKAKSEAAIKSATACLS
jgi:hypothetical protein